VLKSRWRSLEARLGAARMPSPTGVALWDELGCGRYGCVFRVAGDEPLVLKVTSDPAEAAFATAARTLRYWPEGIVRYEDVFALEGAAFRGRPVFVLLREEAHSVGELARMGRLTPDETQFKRRAMTLIVCASQVRAALGRAASWSRALADVERRRDWARGRVSTELLDRGNGDGWAGIERALKPMRGADRIAAALWACEYTIEMLANEPESYTVGRALEVYLDAGMLLADVHMDNIGRVDREGFSEPIWAITDPGHMVPVQARWIDVPVPSIT